jgi:tetratricopeptide (TPR) repeat protein
MTSAQDSPAPPNEPPLRRYIALRTQGDRAGALEAARQACAATPEAPEAHYALGEAATARGDDAVAVAAFAAALHRAPRWADAWVNLGLARYRQGAIGAAKAAMRQALQASHGHPAASGNLAAFLRITGETDAADALLQDALSHSPLAVGPHLNRVADLLQRERPGEALAILDSPANLPTAPAALRQGHLARTLAWLQQGAASQARAALADVAAIGPIPAALAPLWHWRRVLLAQLERNAPEAEAAASDMAAAIAEMGPDAVGEHRIMAHYDLAKFCFARGNTEAAFTHWQHAHTLLRRSQPFSRDAFAALIDATTTNFPAARFTDGPRATNHDPAPVFIVGMPRSGTTLCEQILAAHGAVHGAGERVALEDTAARLAGGYGAAAIPRLAALDESACNAAAADYLAELHALAPDKARIVDKMPGNELHLGLVGLMLPGARIIHCVRDPRDIGLSIWTYRFYGHHPYARDLADLGWTIGKRAHLMNHWRGALPNPILTVALQDWVHDFAATLARVLTHLDLPPDPACARFYEHDRDIRTVSSRQVRQPINAQGLGRWRNCAAHLAPLIAELEAAELIAR